MSNASDFFRSDDSDYIIAVRREIHRRPELGFELDNTVAIVERELDAIGVSHTRKYGPGSVVGYIGPGNGGRTVALRADMDALPVEEETGLEYASVIPGRMHACGHDAHTAMLLGAARALKRAEDRLSSRVKLVFQPSEECDVSGAESMVRFGVMDDVDEIVGLHVSNDWGGGRIGYRTGPSQAGCHPYTAEFFGKSIHATTPEKGCDALAMAVKAYNDIYLMKCRELSPFDEHVLSISCIQGGSVHNVIPAYAKMLISVRFYDVEVDKRMNERIRMICRHAAEEMGGTCRLTDAISTYAVINHPETTERLRAAAEKTLGAENVFEAPKRMSSEDFAHYLQKKPGAMIHLGTRNEEKGCVYGLHSEKMRLDESVLINGSMVLAQYALDAR